MFERLTSQAADAIRLAETRADTLKHHWIGTEHLLLGLLSIEDESAGSTQIFREFGLDRDAARSRILEIVPSREEFERGDQPASYTPRLRRVFYDSLQLTLVLGRHDIGTGHLILGLLAESGVAGSVLLEGGLTFERVCSLVATLPQLEGKPHGPFAPAMQMTPEATKIEEFAMTLAENSEPPEAIGTHHYLLAVLMDEECAAAKILQSFGLGYVAVKERLAELGIREELTAARFAQSGLVGKEQPSK